MNIFLDQKRLDLVFLICLLLTLSIPSVLPQYRLLFFPAFLVIACYQHSRSTCLWLALICGCLIDLLSSDTRFGLYSVDFCLTTLLLYPQRRHFFADSATTLPMMTFLFSSLSTLIMALLLYSIEMKNIFSWNWIITELFIMPLLDACYAFFCFILPGLCFGRRQRRGQDYFSN